MNVLINGEARQLDDGISVATLLDQLELRGQRLAVEINEMIVPRGRHAEHTIKQDDRIEIVRAIGGG